MAAHPSRSFMPTPTPLTDNPSLTLQSVVIIAGAAGAVLLVVIVCCTVVAVATVISCKKRKKHPRLKRDDSLTDNAAYGTTSNKTDVATYRKGDTYDYPRFGRRILRSLRGKKHEIRDRVAGGAEDRPSNTYTMTTTTQSRVAHVTSISGRKEESSVNTPTHINSRRNVAYGTSVSDVREESDIHNSTHINSQRNVVYGRSLSSIDEDSDEVDSPTYINSQRKVSRCTLVSIVSEENDLDDSTYVVDSLESSNDAELEEDEYSYVRYT